MYPRSEIQKLNHRRLIQVKLRFARKRILETVVEMAYARKTLGELPEGMAVPPSWALQAALLVAERWMRPFARITPEHIKANPRGVVKELLGLFDAMVASMAHTASDLPPELRATEEGRVMKKIANDLAKGAFKQYLLKLEKALDVLLPKPTHQELVEHSKRYHTGLTEYFSPDEELGVRGMETLTSQLYYFIFFFWPRLVTIKRIRAVDVQEFLFAETGMHFSTKLTEKVYRDIRMSEAKVAT